MPDDRPAISAETRRLITAACEGRWPDCADMLERIVHESSRLAAWRPARAGFITATTEPKVFMTREEFDGWRRRFKVRGPLLAQITGIKRHGLRMIEGGALITRVEALACAHYALGLAVPAPDMDGFPAWFTPRFGASMAVGEWLGLPVAMLPQCLRGDREAPEHVLRALDFVWRVGPSLPYGDGPSAPLWPGEAAPR